MSRVLSFDLAPLRDDGSGVLRVGDSNVLLETVIRAFLDGATAEAIVQRYETLGLADVYAVIAQYLRHQPEVDRYLASREESAAAVKQAIDVQQGDLAHMRDRLLRRRKAG